MRRVWGLVEMGGPVRRRPGCDPRRRLRLAVWCLPQQHVAAPPHLQTMSDKEDFDSSSDSGSDSDSDDEEYQHVDTGDSLKVKQVLDEATVKAMVDKGYGEVHFIDNLKISLMVAACLFACVGQFSDPVLGIKFPACRPLLGVCCAGYFTFSGILQLVVKFMERDIIFVSEKKPGDAAGIRVRTAFPRFQSDFSVIFQRDAPDAPEMEEKYCVGKFFDTDGYFYEQGLIDVVQKQADKFEAKKKD